MGMMSRTPKARASDDDHREEVRELDRLPDQGDAAGDRDAEEAEVARVLEGVGDGPLGDELHLLQLARRHEAAREGQEAQDDLDDERDHAEGGEALGLAQPQVELGGADEAGGEAAEGVGQRGPLGHRGEGHPRERHADQDSRPPTAPAIQPQFTIPGLRSVPTMASAMPATPASTPWRAVFGSFIQ